MEPDEPICHITAPPNPIFDYPLPQKFSIPLTLLHYMGQNSKSLKLYQACKYFYTKYPFVAFRNLKFSYLCYYNWNVVSTERTNFSRYKFYLSNFKYKIWLTCYLEITHTTPNLASSLCQKLLRCDVSNLHLSNQFISFKEFLILTSSEKLRRVMFKDVTVSNRDGSLVQLEAIFASLTNIKDFKYENENSLSSINPNTAKAIVELPTFKNLERFTISKIPESFDFVIFLNFIKKHEKTRCILFFRDDLAESYKDKLKDFVDKIIEINFKPPPLIHFPGHDGRYINLLTMQHSYFYVLIFKTK